MVLFVPLLPESPVELSRLLRPLARPGSELRRLVVVGPCAPYAELFPGLRPAQVDADVRPELSVARLV